MSAIKEKYNKEIEAGMRPAEHPILFSTEMVKAILEGRKTMTRRVIKYSKKITNPKIGFSAFTDKGEFEVRGVHENGQYGSSFFKMPFVKGDLLWVRESFAPGYFGYGSAAFKADWSFLAAEYVTEPKWKPSIHMPKEAARIWLEITKVRAERLQNISEEDAIAEGVKSNFSALFQEQRYYDYMDIESEWRSAVSSFRSLWYKINGIESWHENPWVWVIKYKVVSTTGKPEIVKTDELTIEN